MKDITISSRYVTIIAITITFIAGVFFGSYNSSTTSFFNVPDSNDILVNKFVGIVKKIEPAGQGQKITVTHVIPAINQNFTQTYYTREALAENTTVNKLFRNTITNMLFYSYVTSYPVLQYSDSGEIKSIRVFSQPVSGQEQPVGQLFMVAGIVIGVGGLAFGAKFYITRIVARGQ